MITLPVVLIAAAVLLLIALLLGLFLQRRHAARATPPGPRTVADLVQQRADREPAPEPSTVDETSVVAVEEPARAGGAEIDERAVDEPAAGAPTSENAAAETVAVGGTETEGHAAGETAADEPADGEPAVAVSAADAGPVVSARAIAPLGDDVPWRRAAQISGADEPEPAEVGRVPALALLRRPARRPLPADDRHPFLPSGPRRTAVPVDGLPVDGPDGIEHAPTPAAAAAPVVAPSVAEPADAEPEDAEPADAEPVDVESTVVEPSVSSSDIEPPVAVLPAAEPVEPPVDEAADAEPVAVASADAEPTVVAPGVAEPVDGDVPTVGTADARPVEAGVAVAAAVGSTGGGAVGEPAAVEAGTADADRAHADSTGAAAAGHEPVSAGPAGGEPTGGEPAAAGGTTPVPAGPADAASGPAFPFTVAGLVAGGLVVGGAHATGSRAADDDVPDEDAAEYGSDVVHTDEIDVIGVEPAQNPAQVDLVPVDGGPEPDVFPSTDPDVLFDTPAGDPEPVSESADPEPAVATTVDPGDGAESDAAPAVDGTLVDLPVGDVPAVADLPAAAPAFAAATSPPTARSEQERAVEPLRRVPRDPEHVAAEQAAADLALLRTFGDPSARPERAPIVALEGTTRPEAPRPVGAPQPVRFRAVGRDGTAVGGAAVALLDDRGREAGAARSATGELTAPHPGAYVLVATAPDHQPGAVALAVGDAPVDAEVLLVRSAALVGTVTGEDGPLAGARVTLVQDGEVVEVAETDVDGAYLVADLASGEYAVSVAAAGCDPDVVLVVVPDETECVHDVELEPAGVRAG